MKIIETKHEITSGKYKIYCTLKENKKVHLKGNGFQEDEFQFTNTNEATLRAFADMFSQCADVAKYAQIPTVNVQSLEPIEEKKEAKCICGAELGHQKSYWCGEEDCHTCSPIPCTPQEKKEERCTKCNNLFLSKDHKHITRKGIFHTACYNGQKIGEEQEVKITIDPEARRELIAGMNKDTEAKLSRYKEALEKLADLGGGMSQGNLIAKSALAEEPVERIENETRSTGKVESSSTWKLGCSVCNHKAMNNYSACTCKCHIWNSKKFMGLAKDVNKILKEEDKFKGTEFEAVNCGQVQVKGYEKET